jgi:hypothetical protein
VHNLYGNNSAAIIKVNSLYVARGRGLRAHSAAEKEIKNGFWIIKISDDGQLLKAPAAAIKCQTVKKHNANCKGKNGENKTREMLFIAHHIWVLLL